MGCPNDKCFDNEIVLATRIDDLITITPLKDTFMQGEVVTFELIIPDSVFFYDNWVSLYQETEDKSPKLITHSELFNNNILDFKYGYQGDEKNWFHLEYNPQKKEYLLKVNVELIRLGDYGIAGRTNDTTFKGKEKCTRYIVTTNIKGHQGGGTLIEFTVIP